MSAFTIPEAVKMDGDRLYVPKVGWLRLAGSNRYADCRPLTVRVRMEGTEQHPKWYAYVCYAVPAEQVKQPAPDGALGLDRNVGQATDSEGTVYAMPDTDPLDAQIAHKQRELSRKQGWGPKDKRPKSNRGRRVNGQLQKMHRKRARKRDNATHQTSRTIADTAHTPWWWRILNTKAMTQSAKGTVEKPRQAGQAEVGAQPRHPGQRLGRVGAQAGLQDGGPAEGGPGLHVADVQPLRPCPPGQPAVAGGVRVRGLRVPGQRRPQCGDQHFGAGGTSVRARFGPRDRGGCTARGDPVGDPDDP